VAAGVGTAAISGYSDARAPRCSPRECGCSRRLGRDRLSYPPQPGAGIPLGGAILLLPQLRTTPAGILTSAAGALPDHAGSTICDVQDSLERFTSALHYSNRWKASSGRAMSRKTLPVEPGL